MSKQSKIWQELGGIFSDKYWSYNNIRGQQMVDYFKDKDVKSFFEIGCNSGRNLYYISKNLSGKEMSGIEISSRAAEDARKHLPDATIYNEDIHLATISKTYDVVYTGGVLMHIEPNLISDVLKKCLSLSNKYVIHMEPIGNDIITHGPKELNPLKIRNALRCLHNIEKLYNKLGYTIINKANYLGSNEAFIILRK